MRLIGRKSVNSIGKELKDKFGFVLPTSIIKGNKVDGLDVCLKLFTNEKDLVLNPFLGGQTAYMSAVIKNGCNFVGYDLVKKRIEMHRELWKRIMKELVVDVKLYNSDSTLLDFTENDSIDFAFAFMPIMRKSSTRHEKHVGNTKECGDFTKNLFTVLGQVFRVIKAGKYFVAFVRDYRKKYYSAYHIDINYLCVDIGFELWDSYILDLGNPKKIILSDRILTNRHMHILVFRKEKIDEL